MSEPMMRRLLGSAFLLLCAGAWAEPGASDKAFFEAVGLGQRVLERRLVPSSHSPFVYRYGELKKAFPSMDGVAARRELEAFERAMILASVGYVGTPYSPNLGWESSPGRRLSDFEQDVVATRQDLETAVTNLLRHGIPVDCSAEFARMEALRRGAGAVSAAAIRADPLYVQGFALYREICEERLRLGAQIRNWTYARDAAVRTADFRRTLGETPSDLSAPLARFDKAWNNYRFHYVRGRVCFAATFEKDVEKALADLRAAAFGSEKDARRIRPGLSFVSCGAFGFGGTWQTCLNFNVRNASLFRSGEDDFSLYRDSAAQWSVDFAPVGCVFDRFEMKEGSWVHAWRDNVFRTEKGGVPRHLETCWSELAPGILFRAPKGTDAVTVSAQLKAGPVAPDTVFGCFGGKPRQFRAGEGIPLREMEEGWLLFAWNAGDEPKLPVLVYFARRPESAGWTADGSFVLASVAGRGLGDFAVTTLNGAVPTGRTVCDAATLAQCRKVAGLLANFPVDAEEFYAFEDATRLKVWNRVTKRVNLAGEWKFKAPDYAPFVPLYTMREDFVRPCEPVTVDAFLTRFGSYRVVAGNVISYVLPVPDLLERVPLRPVSGEEAYLGRLEGLVRTALADSRPWVSKGLTGGIAMDAATAFPLLPSALRHVFDSNAEMGLSDLSASGEWGADEAKSLNLRQRTADYLVDPVSGRGAFLAGWRGMNLGMPIRGDMTIFNYLPLYAAYAEAKLFGRWSLVRRHWPRFCELHEAMDFSQTWRGPGVNTLASGVIVYGDMFGDGLRGEYLMYRAAQALGDAERAERALYAATKEVATLVNCLSPAVKAYNAAVKNTPQAASPEACVGQLGFGHAGFRTAPWRPYSPDAWNAPFQSIGCHSDSPFFGCLTAFARQDADAWLLDFMRAIPEWYESAYLSAQRGERFEHAVNHLRYLAQTTSDRASLREKAEKGVLTPACAKPNRLPRLMALLADLIAQGDPVRIGEWGRATLVRADYDRATRTAFVDLVAPDEDCLTLVSSLKPASAMRNGSAVGLKAGAHPGTWELPIVSGVNAFVLRLPDGEAPVRAGPSPAASPRRFQKAAPPVLSSSNRLPPSRYQVGVVRTVDLASVANAVRSDTAPSGETNEKWRIPSEDVVCGVPFAFVDEAKNGGRGMVQLGNWKTRREKLSREVTIPVGRRARRLFFLHGLGYSSANYFGVNGELARKSPVLEYTLKFRGAPSRKLVMRDGVEIGSWKAAPGCKGLAPVPCACAGNVYPAAEAGQYGEGVGGYVFCWENDVRADGVTNQDVEQRSLAELESVTARAVGSAVPILLAITVEE